MVTTRASGDGKKGKFRFLWSDDERRPKTPRRWSGQQSSPTFEAQARVQAPSRQQAGAHAEYRERVVGGLELCGGVVTDSPGKVNCRPKKLLRSTQQEEKRTASRRGQLGPKLPVWLSQSQLQSQCKGAPRSVALENRGGWWCWPRGRDWLPVADRQD